MENQFAVQKIAASIGHNTVSQIAASIGNLNKVIDDRFALHPGDALYASGFAESQRAGWKTARNKLWQGTYPFPVTNVAGKRVVLVRDLLVALGLAESTPAPQPLPTPAKPAIAPLKRGRGRPRKVAVDAVEGGVK